LTAPGERGTMNNKLHAEGVSTMPDKGPGSKGGAKKPKGGGKAASKNGKK
jgi:hypothetical protein